MTTQTVIHMMPDEIRLMMREEIRAQLAEKAPTEPHPNEPCSIEWIAKRCDVGAKTIKNRINEMKIPKLKGKPVTIAYKHIKELELKNFNPHK